MEPHIFDETFQKKLTQLFCHRRDVRHFKTDPVNPKLIKKLINITQLSPSVGLSQPWRFIEIKNPETRKIVINSFEECNKKAAQNYSANEKNTYLKLKLQGLREAPVQFAVFADTKEKQGKKLGTNTMPETLQYSVVIAIHTLWLAARAYGLGMGWISIIDPEKIKYALQTPKQWHFIAYLCIGWPKIENDKIPMLEKQKWEKRRKNKKIHLTHI